MLSAGLWHKRVPKEPLKNLLFRKGLVEAAAKDARIQRGLIEACKSDILFYINTFVFQFNPKKKGGARVGPFITWPFQDRALLDRPETTGRKGVLWCYEKDRSAVIEKSREMGASWLFLIFQDWLGLFHDYSQSLNISKSAAAVDSKNPDSLFWKIRFMHEKLPDWLKGPIVEEKMYIGYERTKSVATGESSTGRAGVGGRAGVIFIDEFPQIDEDVEVRQRTAGTSDCRFFNGTHLGVGTEFYKLTESPEFVKIQMHWTQHPDKNKGLYRYNQETCKVEFLWYNEVTDRIEPLPANATKFQYEADFEFVMDGSPTGGPNPGVRSPWYDWKCQDIGSERGVSMELDINAKGSVSQFYNALMIRKLKSDFCCPAFWQGDLKYDRENGQPIALVETQGGLVKLWMNLLNGLPPVSTYGAGADISQGLGATPSCLSIFDGRTGRKVLEYVNAYIEPLEFGSFCVAMCWLFKDEDGMGAKLAWEHKGPGASFGKRVWKDLGYRNLYYRTTEHALKQEVSDTPGWHPSKPTKLILHTDYRAALHDMLCLNYSEEALDETLAYKYSPDGSVEHAGYYNKDDAASSGENHGDIVVADALGWKMVKDVIRDATQRKHVEQETQFGSLAFRRKMRDDRRKREMAWS